MRMKKIVLLDFCGTVVDYQTAIPFLWDVIKNNTNPVKFFFLRKILSRLVYLTDRFVRHFVEGRHLLKSFVIRSTRGIPRSEFDNMAVGYYEHQLKPHFIEETIRLVRHYQETGYEVILLSAALDFYLTLFAREYGISKIICTNLEFVDGVSAGRIKGTDCIDHFKPILFRKQHGQIQSEEIIGITDSITDIPMLNLCDKKIVISKNTHQNWLDSTMEEIIYESER